MSDGLAGRPKRAPLGRGLAALFGETGARAIAERLTGLTSLRLSGGTSA